MARLMTPGISIELPDGWDGRITRRADHGVDGAAATAASSTDAPMLLHAASFPLPADTSDFGGGAVEVMHRGDLIVTLFEYGRESVGTALFAEQGMPRRLRADQFDQNLLQHNLPGQTGSQHFFTESGRAWCLYVVLGHHLTRFRVLPVLNDVLATVEFGDL